MEASGPRSGLYGGKNMSANGNLLEILTLINEKGGLSGKYIEEYLDVDRRKIRN